MVYIIHFKNKLHHAQHYVGYVWGDDFTKRIKQHRNGTGAKILKACNERGIQYRVVVACGGGRDLERWIKNQKNTAQFCPVCSAKPRQFKEKYVWKG